MPRGFCIAERGKVAQAPPPCPVPPSPAGGWGTINGMAVYTKFLTDPPKLETSISSLRIYRTILRINGLRAVFRVLELQNFLRVALGEPKRVLSFQPIPY